MKVVVLGGASFSTPALFASMHGAFLGSDFFLVARSASNLESAARASRLVAGDDAPRITPVVCTPDSSGSTLMGADVILVQMRIGNMPGRAFDERFPLGFDMCGDEGLGAGGVSAAWRSWPHLEPWFQAIRRFAPKATVLLMSSPVGILTRAAHLRFPELNVVGICEVPFVALRDMCTVTHADFTSMIFDYLGVNHIGWLYGVKSGPRDLVREFADVSGRKQFPPANLINTWGGVPTKYLQLHFDLAGSLQAQRAASIARADELQALQVKTLEFYATASAAEVILSLRRRGTPWYSDSIVPLLRGLQHGDESGPFFLSGPNRGQTAACAPDDILEVGCVVRDGRIERIAQNQSPPPGIAEFISAFCLHERLATEAVLGRKRETMEDALRQHPWVASAAAADISLPAALTDTILKGNEKWISRGRHRST